MKDYDSTNFFAARGFGGRVPDSENPSHCFALNGDIYNPECNGVEGVLKAYANSINKVRLSGPTNFAPSIREVNSYAKHCEAEVSQHN